jgi:hypothetical protein
MISGYPVTWKVNKNAPTNALAGILLAFTLADFPLFLTLGCIFLICSLTNSAAKVFMATSLASWLLLGPYSNKCVLSNHKNSFFASLTSGCLFEEGSYE